MNKFLPISIKEATDRGWNEFDYICVTGDAYVDHPSFGIAIISRLLESLGYRVGIIAQPNFHSCEDFKRLGRPKYGFFVTSGNIDSMVSNYTVALKKRSDDAYSPGGKGGKRPDRAVIVYCNKIREAFSDTPIIIGGLEASLRRFAHYDYWDDKVRRSILFDSGADVLIYGMGESQTVAITEKLKNGGLNDLHQIKGISYLSSTPPEENFVTCSSFEEVSKDKKKYAIACKTQYNEADSVIGRTVIQKCENRFLISTPPALPLDSEKLDAVYNLPYMRMYHDSYEKFGGVPAIEEVEFSITHNRGCFGACNFCSLSFHQGRYITSRSDDSVVNEAENMVKNPRFKGYIHDVGGPTANFKQPSCQGQLKRGMCKNKKCLAPVPCEKLEVNHKDYLSLLRKLREIKGIKKVFIRSGIRYDYLMLDKDKSFLRELVKYHVSGQLKVAPEHSQSNVLDKMGKPPISTFQKFSGEYFLECKKAGLEQYLVPYLMSSHPGCTLKDAIALAIFLKKNNIRPQQVQDFYPTPATISTCMYYTGLDPFTLKEVYVPKSTEEKAMQRALLQYYLPSNKDIVIKTLIREKRQDLIGFGDNNLVSQQSQVRQKLEQQKSGNKNYGYKKEKETHKKGKFHK